LQLKKNLDYSASQPFNCNAIKSICATIVLSVQRTVMSYAVDGVSRHIFG